MESLIQGTADLNQMADANVRRSAAIRKQSVCDCGNLLIPETASAKLGVNAKVEYMCPHCFARSEYGD